jgi:phage gp29-like protein
MKINTYLTSFRQDSIARQTWNPIRALTPASLSRVLDAFHAGQLKQAALIWEAIERRDDLLQGVISKRKKAIARLPWEILTIDNTEEATQQKEILEHFYNNAICINAYDENERGGLSLLIKQMMDAIGKRYAVHEIVFKPLLQEQKKYLTAEFRFVPLWFFENKDGHLHFVQANKDKKIPLSSGEWLVTTGDGLMESCSIAYLFKHLPLRDWLIYCERNGMPGVKGVTNARPGSNEWEIAREAVKNFGAEFHALMSTGTDIQAIDISGKGELPYPKLVERMDRAMAALWRGSDLTTFSQQNGTGASVQWDEKTLLEEEDAQMISDTLNNQVDRYVLKYLVGTEQPKAYFQLKFSPNKNLNNDLAIFKTLWDMGVALSLNDIREHFGLNPPCNASDTLQHP